MKKKKDTNKITLTTRVVLKEKCKTPSTFISSIDKNLFYQISDTANKD